MAFVLFLSIIILIYAGELLYKGPLSSCRCVHILMDLEFWIENAFEAAEPHLLASGTRDSARILSEMFVQWASAGGSPGAFAIRGILPYVLSFHTGNSTFLQ